jgi:hypothetical protein
LASGKTNFASALLISQCKKRGAAHFLGITIFNNWINTTLSLATGRTKGNKYWRDLDEQQRSQAALTSSGKGTL